MPKINISRTLLDLRLNPCLWGQTPTHIHYLNKLGLLYSGYNLLYLANNIFTLNFPKIQKFSAKA